MYCDTINYQMVYTYKDNLNENSLKYSYHSKSKNEIDNSKLAPKFYSFVK